MYKFYDVHVFYGHSSGYSVFLKTVHTDLDDDGVISEAINQKVLDPADADLVDYVQEIEEQEYLDATK